MKYDDPICLAIETIWAFSPISCFYPQLSQLCMCHILAISVRSDTTLFTNFNGSWLEQISPYQRALVFVPAKNNF